MLEIDKQKERFSDDAIREMTKDYDRNFLQTPKEEKPLPNSPYPEEGTGSLFKKSGTRDKKKR